ncbi:uncharacterized protein EKO05_0000316 [Ascochyta rabiei]|uniref:Uncharacterized protein n=1 Tax=Didymella rabiei TaxID=5454 RepID=A0A162VBC0_DIDRA|nr:uncharacterized protein EKO05_0000316 [Ascochyta rabiei]KZM18341.1 hypothetical protein ST47_g10480 [Ascochyta rabiei]UPX09631.1 hypothetical protein EKO05_0000316 [Ascochyta rabiei]
MLIRTLTSLPTFTAVAGALPYSFVLDVDSIDGAAIDGPPSAPLLLTTTEAFGSPTTALSPFPTSIVSMLAYAPVRPAIVTTTGVGNTTLTTCLPTTVITITLPNPTPRPTTGSERSDDRDTSSNDENSLTDNDSDDAATPFDTSTPEPLSAWPHWFTAATFTLVFYDAITLGLFVWLWVFGYLWWFGRGRETRMGGWVRRGAVSESMEMAPTLDRHGRYERTSEWVGSGRSRYGRARSRSWERARSLREAELESEMRRLGMI